MMSEAAEPSTPANALTVEPRLLQEGEVVIIAVKPSAWYILLAAWPVIVFAVLLAGGAELGSRLAGPDFPRQTLRLLALAAVLVRVGMACMTWMGHLYVLTNLRVMHVRGLSRFDVQDCPLKAVTEIQVSCILLERILGLGTMVFATHKRDAPHVTWAYVAQVQRVRELAEAALRAGK